MEHGTFLRVSPVSHKGKNRINECGDVWRVLEAHPVVNMDDFVWAAQLADYELDALYGGGPRNARWIRRERDEHLRIEEVWA